MFIQKISEMIFKEFIFFGYNSELRGASITPENLGETVIQLKQRGIEHVAIINWTRETSLDFLIDQHWIKSLHLSIEHIDVSPVNSLKSLEHFECNYNNLIGNIDLTNFSNLKQLKIIYSKKLYSNFEKNDTIQYLEIGFWPYKDFEGLKKLKHIEWLEFNFAKKLISLNGIHYLNKLRRLKFYSAPKLEDISELKEISNTLNKLSFELVPKVKNFDVIGSLPNLESFYISRSAPIPSVQFIKHLKKLKYAYIGTEVLDNNVEILKEKKIEYKKSKKYT